MRITPPTGANEATHWRRCAEEARRSAEESLDQITKQTLVDIAEAYEQLAAVAEAKLAANKCGAKRAASPR
jgi:hypothetical protein